MAGCVISHHIQPKTSTNNGDKEDKDNYCNCGRFVGHGEFIFNYGVKFCGGTIVGLIFCGGVTFTTGVVLGGSMFKF